VTAVLAAVAVFLLPGAAQPLPQVAAPAPATEIDSAEVLGQLADLAAAQPPPPAKPFDYLHLITWGGPPGEPELRTEDEVWLNDDGVGRRLSTTDGEVSDTGARDPVGDFGPPPRMPDLPTDPAALEAALLATRTGYDTSHLYDLMIRTWHFEVLDPQVNAAFLRLWATKDDVQVIGPTTDRLGRQGIGVTLTVVEYRASEPSVPSGFVTTHTLVLDPQTGAPLGYDRYETYNDQPSMRNATAWLETGRVDSIDERP
jgi:hypothetical protein